MRPWERCLGVLIVAYVALTLPILNHVVTWCDPGWWSYLAFDLLHGREMPSNLMVERLVDVADPVSYAFFRYDLRSALAWDAMLALVMGVFGQGFFAVHTFVVAWSVALVLVGWGLAREWGADRDFAAQVAILLLLDYQVFWMGTMARPDMAATTLAYAGILLWMRARRTGCRALIAAAAALWCLAFGTHPLSIIVVASFCAVEAGASFVRHRGSWQKGLGEAWPMVAGVTGYLAVVAVWSEAFALTGEAARASATFDLGRALIGEWREKFVEPYTRRYAIGVLVLIVASTIGVLADAVRRRDGRILALGAMLAGLFVFGSLLDVSAATERLLYYTPLLAAILGLGLRQLFERVRARSWRTVILALVVMGILVPRAGKYGQIAANWEHTNYELFTAFVKQHVPPGSVIIGDASLMWGLHDHGVKILQDAHLREGIPNRIPREVVRRARYAVINDTPGGFATFFPREDFFRVLDARVTRVASFRGRPGYGYEADVLRLEFDP